MKIMLGYKALFSTQEKKFLKTLKKSLGKNNYLFVGVDLIKNKIAEGQCYLNHDPEPLKTWKKYNKHEN